MRHEFPGCGGTVKIWKEEDGPIRHVVELGPNATGMYVLERAYEGEILRLAERVCELESCLGQVQSWREWHRPADESNDEMRVRNELRRLLGNPRDMAERIAALEGVLVKAGEERENADIREAGWQSFGDEVARALDIVAGYPTMRDAILRAIRKLNDENARLRLSDARLTSLRLEVEAERVRSGRQQRSIAALADDNAALRTDLAAAIKTGEALAAERDRLREDIATMVALKEAIEILRRLDSLLASEEPPEGLLRAVSNDPTLDPERPQDWWRSGGHASEVALDAWRWFQKALLQRVAASMVSARPKTE